MLKMAIVPARKLATISDIQIKGMYFMKKPALKPLFASVLPSLLLTACVSMPQPVPPATPAMPMQSYSGLNCQQILEESNVVDSWEKHYAATVDYMQKQQAAMSSSDGFATIVSALATYADPSSAGQFEALNRSSNTATQNMKAAEEQAAIQRDSYAKRRAMLAELRQYKANCY